MFTMAYARSWRADLLVAVNARRGLKVQLALLLLLDGPTGGNPLFLARGSFLSGWCIRRSGSAYVEQSAVGWPGISRPYRVASRTAQGTADRGLLLCPNEQSCFLVGEKYGVTRLLGLFCFAALRINMNLKSEIKPSASACSAM